jgi:Ca-activated chloride channel homolog
MNKLAYIGLWSLFVSLALYVSVNENRPSNISEFWKTRNQQGMKFFKEGNYKTASSVFDDPMLKGAALYRDAEFEKAAMSFRRVGTATALFNTGNALLMMGKYQLAIEAYEQSLKLDPDFLNSEFNKKIAKARWLKLENAKDDDHQGTGGKLAADEIVIDNKTGNSNDIDSSTVGETNTEDETNALWLKRVESKPAEFLKIKFLYQLHKQSEK